MRHPRRGRGASFLSAYKDRAVDNSMISTISVGSSTMVSEQGAAELVKVMIERGYFHAPNDPAKPVNAKPKQLQMAVLSVSLSSRSVEGNKWDETEKTKFPWDDALLVQTTNGDYVTLEALQVKFNEELKLAGRWKSLTEAAEQLQVYEKDVERVIPAVVKRYPSTVRAGQQVVSKGCLDGLTMQALTMLDESGGFLELSKIAEKIYGLPTDVAFTVLSKRLLPHIFILRVGSGAKALVTQDYLSSLRQQVMDVFVSLKEPVKVKSVASREGWEPAWVAKIVLEVKGELPGRLSGDIYVPAVHTEKKNQAVLDFFSANGFVTTDECSKMEILPSEMKQVLLNAFPTALVLKFCVIHPDMIVTPLQAAVQGAVSAKTWLDLSVHLPGQILSQEDDTNTIVNEYILSQVKHDHADMIAISSKGALFFSKGFVDEVSEELIPGLIETYAKARAEELSLIENEKAAAKEAASATRKKSVVESNGPADPTVGEYGAVPLNDVILAMVEAYPELAEMAKTSDKGVETLLGDLVRQTLYTDDFEMTCENAVDAELTQLRSQKTSKTSRVRKDAASQIRKVEGAFEDTGCFTAACYLIQVLAKFVQYATESDLEESVVDSLKKDMLRGCCADFTGRITQFCIFKHEVDVPFSLGTEGIQSHDLPYYCSQVDSAVRFFPLTFLSCGPDEASKMQDPLPALREVLPGSVGVSLARQWVLCGGESYDGGIKKSDDGSDFTRPGDFDGFLAHVEENCLTECGLPFKKMDKKAEKHFLFGRRKMLTSLLEKATKPEDILELSVMILYQLTKNLVVSGSLLRGPILKLLCKEKKISLEAASVLAEVAESLERGDAIVQVKLELLKDHCLGRV